MDELALTPPQRCNGCGLKTKNMKEKGHGWLMIRMRPGLAIFACSKCHSVFLNTDALSNIEIVKKAAGRKVQVYSDLDAINQAQGN